MSRPRKYTVDYFPHICKQGKTIFILEARYGNDGYAFWFKLLELLSTSNGHYFDCSNPMQLEFLGAKTRVSSEKTKELLGLLVGLGAIDKDLWENHSIIWCQNLVNNIADAYDNRTSILPEKPYFTDGLLRQNIDNHKYSAVIPQKTTVLPTDNPHTILYNTILNNTNNKGDVLEKQPPTLDELKNTTKNIEDKGKGTPLVEVFARIDKLRGYRPPKRKAEAASILRMLKTYTPDQIINTWEKLKAEDFWQGKELYLMSVESQIGAKLNGKIIKHQEGIKIER